MHAYGKQDIVNDRRRRRRLAPVAAGLALALGLAACGESDEGAAPTTNQPAASPAPAADPANATEDLSAFCTAVIGADAAFAASGPEGPDPAQLEAALREVQSSAPLDIATDVDRLVLLIQQAFSSSEQEGPPPPEVEELDARIDDYVLANCDFDEVAVTGTEYEFQGLGEPVEAGQTAFTFANEGGEEHELVLIRINDGVTQSVQELVALPEEEAFAMVEVKGFAMAPPGGEDVAFVDLEPGRYGALCFFPVGSTPEALAAAEESGQEIEAPPHFTQGMVAEFTVE